MSLYFILVNPAVPANIGAAARAMKTMGFDQLRLVNPCDHLCLESRMLAHGSHEVLENARVYSTLTEAVADIDFVIGTTARRRTRRNLYIPVEHLPELINGKGKSIKEIALVFGSEESGLSNENAKRCHILSSISMVAKYPSLNLAQAVMIYSYNLSVLSGKKLNRNSGRKNPESWLILKNKTEQLFDNLKIKEGDLSRDKLLERMALLDESDVFLLHSIVARLLPRKHSDK